MELSCASVFGAVHCIKYLSIAMFSGLCFNDADHLAVSVKELIRFAFVQRELSNGHDNRSLDVHGLAVLDEPPAGLQLPVDGMPRWFFGSHGSHAPQHCDKCNAGRNLERSVTLHSMLGYQYNTVQAATAPRKVVGCGARKRATFL
jgi:hypothetical protein